MSDDTRATVLQVFREVLGLEIPSPDTDLIESGLLDSLSLVTLVFEIQQRCSISIPIREPRRRGLPNREFDRRRSRSRRMSSIRPMERADLDAVAGLYERVVRSGSTTPAPGVPAWFQQTCSTIHGPTPRARAGADLGGGVQAVLLRVSAQTVERADAVE